MSLPPVSLIIPNFNGAALLARNLPSVLAALTAYPGGGEVIVVDDGSRDDSLAILREQFPAVRAIAHAENQGFAEAVHSGVRAAAHAALILLNSDVEPDADFIAPLIRRLGEPEVFAVQSAICVEPGKLHPYCLFRFRFRFGALQRIATPDLGAKPWLALYASGGSMAVDKARFNELGGFHPLFKPFYWEDFDLGVRAWRRGWRSVLEPTSVVLHQEHGAIADNVKRQRVRRALQGHKLIAEWIHFPAGTLALYALPRVLLRGLARTLAGDVGYWLALTDALRRIPEIRALRQGIAQKARQSFPEVLQQIAAANAVHEREGL